MNQEDRKERIRLLQIKTRQKVLLEDILKRFGQIDIPGFLGIEETTELSKRAYNKIYTTESPKEIADGMGEALQHLIGLQEQFKQGSDKAWVLFHPEDRETGAVLVHPIDLLNHAEEWLRFVGFADGKHDLLIVERNLRAGICIEMHEYGNGLCVWGLYA